MVNNMNHKVYVPARVSCVFFVLYGYVYACLCMYRCNVCMYMRTCDLVCALVYVCSCI